MGTGRVSFRTGNRGAPRGVPVRSGREDSRGGPGQREVGALHVSTETGDEVDPLPQCPMSPPGRTDVQEWDGRGWTEVVRPDHGPCSGSSGGTGRESGGCRSLSGRLATKVCGLRNKGCISWNWKTFEN